MSRRKICARPKKVGCGGFKPSTEHHRCLDGRPNPLRGSGRTIPRFRSLRQTCEPSSISSAWMGTACAEVEGVTQRVSEINEDCSTASIWIMIIMFCWLTCVVSNTSTGCISGTGRAPMHKPPHRKRTCLRSRQILASTSDGLLLGTDTHCRRKEVSTPFEFEPSPQNIPVNLCQITEGIDESKRHSSRLSWHVAESRCSIGKCAGIRCPQPSSHDDQKTESCFEVVHGTNYHGGDQTASEPSRDD
jgi:hypothetical protein